MQTDLVFLLLFTLAIAVALVARLLRLPYTVALVAAGLLVCSLRLVEPPHLTQELLYALILPGLLFEAAFHIDATAFWRNRLAIHALAVPGVVDGIAVTAGILAGFSRAGQILGGFTLSQGLVFGALIAATARASCSNRLRRSGSATNSSGSTLTATSRPRRESRARQTSPIPPAPIDETTS
jgi:CPA1 family monovalent cation:H+ antiporter